MIQMRSSIIMLLSKKLKLITLTEKCIKQMYVIKYNKLYGILSMTNCQYHQEIRIVG